MPGAQTSGPQSEARSAASFHLNVSRCALSADIQGPRSQQHGLMTSKQKLDTSGSND
jgi:hypothetical protein